MVMILLVNTNISWNKGSAAQVTSTEMSSGNVLKALNSHFYLIVHALIQTAGMREDWR